MHYVLYNSVIHLLSNHLDISVWVDVMVSPLWSTSKCFSHSFRYTLWMGSILVKRCSPVPSKAQDAEDPLSTIKETSSSSRVESDSLIPAS